MTDTGQAVAMGVVDQDELSFLNPNWLSDDELTLKENARIVTDYREAMALLNDEPTMALDLETIPDPALLLPEDVAEIDADDPEALAAWQTSNYVRKYGALSPWKGKIAVIALYGPVANVCAVIHRPAGDPPEAFVRWLASPTPAGETREYLTHNGACFDIPFMAVNGMPWKQVRWWDTLISEQTSLTTGRKDVSVSLGKVFQRRLGKALKGKVDHAHWANAWLTREQLDYVTGDIKYLHSVRDEHVEICGKDLGFKTRAWALKWEARLLPVVVRMQLRGIPIDMDALGTYLEQQRGIAETARETLYAELGEINFKSVPQLKKAFAARGYPLENTREETFKDLMYEHAGTELGALCTAMVDYRHATKRTSMYSEEFVARHVVYHPEFGHHFVHPNFRQLGTDTGRFSSSNPNMQQVPRDMRWVYGNVPGYEMVGVDFSAIEVRAMAAICGCEALIEALESEDIHTYVASQIYDKDAAEVISAERQVAKAVTFTLIFFGSPNAVVTYSKQFGGKLDLTDAARFSQKFYQRFPGVEDERQESKRIAAAGGIYPIVLPSGLRRHLVGNENLTPQRIMNTKVQGTAAVFVKRALIDTLTVPLPWAPGETLADRLCATIHDEILMLVETAHAEWARAQLEAVMVEAAYKVLNHRRVPIAVEGKVGRTWPK